MNDQELLEMAAKAAGYEIDFEADINGWYPQGYDEFGDVHVWWNPLADDGDALRLAVKLGMAVEVSNRKLVWVSSECLQHTVEIRFDETADKYAATRCAIVRAAAEIGLAIQNWESSNG